MIMQQNSYCCHPVFKKQQLMRILLGVQNAINWNIDDRIVHVKQALDDEGMRISVLDSFSRLPIYTVLVCFGDKLDMSRILIPHSKIGFLATNNDVNGVNQNKIDEEINALINTHNRYAEYQWFWSTPFDDRVHEIHFSDLKVYLQIVKHKQSRKVQTLISPFHFLKKMFFKRDRLTGFSREEIINKLSER